MSKSAKVAIIVMFVAGFLALLIYSSIGLDSVTCEVCVAFNGEVVCRSASATNEPNAIQTATGNACAFVAFGRDESMACAARPPESVACTAQ